jgi:hypothetical protein
MASNGPQPIPRGTSAKASSPSFVREADRRRPAAPTEPTPRVPDDGVVRVFRERVAEHLRALGYTVKLAGG